MTEWWRDAVIYQIYPRSFADSDGDGVGDLPGIVANLDALVELGVDAIWLNPFYRSPQVDAGYDVEDHCDVDPCFGTLHDVDALLERAHVLGLRVIVDLVPNHTSDRHPWFREALTAPAGSAARRRYMFRPGAGPDGALPPNDWHSVFGGPAWSRAPTAGDSDSGSEGGASGQGDHEEWYLHLFAPEQPDLDWTNREVRDEFESILRFWLDRGVDGFRIDVAHGLAKDPEMPDLAGRFATGGLAETGHPHWDQDEVHDVYRSWRRVIDEYPGDRVFVAEAYLADPGRLARYVRDDELHTAFNFRFLMADWDADQLRHAIVDTLETHDAVGAPATWVLSN
ncbi:MAG: alpha-amylase family glycosyl hydrolase, partial [Microthrixaceae bacterium]